LALKPPYAWMGISLLIFSTIAGYCGLSFSQGSPNYYLVSKSRGSSISFRAGPNGITDFSRTVSSDSEDWRASFDNQVLAKRTCTKEQDICMDVYSAQLPLNTSYIDNRESESPSLNYDIQQRTYNEKYSWIWTELIKTLLWFWKAVNCTILFFQVKCGTLDWKIAKCWYSYQIDTHPLVTKAISAGFMSLIGDYLAQMFEIYTEPQVEVCVGASNRTPILLHPQWFSKYDLRRSIAQICEALFVSGPIMHFAYNFLEEILPIADDSIGTVMQCVAALTHVAIDILVMDSFFVASMLCAPGILEGRDLMSDIFLELKQDIMPALKASWYTSLLFFPIQFLSFRCLPVPFRVLAINCQDIVWTAVVSFISYRSRRKNQALSR